jgi:gamma-glutamyltranspeptidase
MTVTKDRIEAALIIVARHVVALGGDVYLPVYERLERELAALEARETAIDRARRLVRERQRGQIKVSRAA